MGIAGRLDGTGGLTGHIVAGGPGILSLVVQVDCRRVQLGRGGEGLPVAVVADLAGCEETL